MGLRVQPPKGSGLLEEAEHQLCVWTNLRQGRCCSPAHSGRHWPFARRRVLVV